MATVSHVTGSQSTNTNNQSSYTSTSATPTGNALLLVFAMITASDDPAPACTGSANGMTFTLVASQAKPTNVGDKVYCFVSDQLTPASPVAMTATVSLPSDPATGGVVSIEQVTGMTLTGLSAIRQFDVSNGGAGTTPDVVFPSAVDTNNPTVIGHIDTSGTGTTPPTGWTEAYDVTFINPTTGASVVYRDSGFSGTTVTWGSTSTQHAQVGVELDASAGGATGTASVANANDTSSASGLEVFTGTAAVTGGSDTSSAIGAEVFTGTAAVTNAADTSSATALEVFTGTSSRTNGNDTSSASGTVTNPTVSGTGSVTEAADTSSASGTAQSIITGSAAVVSADDSAAADGEVGTLNWFRTPTTQRLAGTRRLYNLYTLPKGVSVVKVDGHYRRYPIPPHTLLAEMTESVDYFIGGKAAVTVSAAVAAELTADGFTVYDHNPDED